MSKEIVCDSLHLNNKKNKEVKEAFKVLCGFLASLSMRERSRGCAVVRSVQAFEQSIWSALDRYSFICFPTGYCCTELWKLLLRNPVLDIFLVIRLITLELDQCKCSVGCKYQPSSLKWSVSLVMPLLPIEQQFFLVSYFVGCWLCFSVVIFREGSRQIHSSYLVGSLW